MKNASIAERERITCYVRDELQNFTRINKGGEIKPTNVQHRLTEDALYRKYMLVVNDVVVGDETSNSRGHSSRTSVSDEPKSESMSELISTSVSGSDDEKMEILVQPNAVQYNGPRQQPMKQTKALPPFPIIQPMLKNQSLLKPRNSLLKPMHQRIIEENEGSGICIVRPEIGLTKKHTEQKLQQQMKQAPPPSPKDQSQSHSQSQPRPQQLASPMNLVRMRLSAALCKAKDAQSQQTRIQPDSPETIASQSESPPSVTQTLTVKCNTTPLSSSQSSNDSSPSATEVEPMCEVDASEMEQDKFLGLFNLFTPSHMTYLMNRRPQRKKRVCTSTERMDYYYGKYDLFEKQFTKRNKRQFLYSPPATRAKRRIASNGLAKDVIKTAAAAKRNNKGMKSNASSSSSLSSNGSLGLSEKVCLTCYKRSK